MHWTATVGAPGSSALVPYLFVSRQTAEALVTTLDRSLDALQAAIDGAAGGPKPASMLVPDVHVRLQVDVARATGPNARNVAGLLRGRDAALRDEVVVLGGHHDHVGRGFFGSAGGPAAEGHIHPGADDNASGTALLLEVAEAMVAAPTRPRRSVLF
ncbi:MAG: M28 family peptidase, partial [Actinomycetota bacterium]